MMNLLKIKQTMIEKGIPAEVMERFVFPETEEETPEEKVAFAAQMDHLLSKDQILSVMEEQGCSKEEHPEIWLKLKGKPIEERIKILNAMDISEYPRSRINDDGTLSVFWNFEKDGKYICVCPFINKLSTPATVSLTYCGCCSGHAKYHAENSLGVKLRLIETVSSPISSNGEKYCEHRFEILNPEWAMCGCRCDLCKAYAPNVEKDDQREALAKMWSKYYHLDPSVMDSCGGCRNNPSDEDCPVRKCVLEKKLKHCGDCGEFPCGVFYQRCGSFPGEKKKDFDMDEYNEYMLAYDNETRLKEYKAKQAQLKKVSEETMRFMRGKYTLDEVGNGKDALSFLDGEQTILTIYIREGYYIFAVGQDVIQVADLETLERVKTMIIDVKKPNRKPLPKNYINMSNCGHRCDLCVHNKGKTSISAEEMEYARACCAAVYGADSFEMNCDGCHFPDCTVESAHCRKEKGIEKCGACGNYFTCLKTAGWPPEIHTRTITADQVTWAILPYVKGQYGN